MSTKVNGEGHLGMSGDEVVISGISGIFPNSDSVSDFMKNLYDKVDMVTNEDPKWVLNDPDHPKHMGTIRGMNRFDAQFFGVTYQLARVVEPMGKKLLEHAYGAIIDSGTSPQSVRGKPVGVFIGSSFTDTSALLMFDISKRSDFIVNGSSKAMLSNRISYWIDGKGPSLTVDGSCTSSSACLEMAYKSIKNGECDSALVGGCNFGIHPNLVRNMRRAGLLCLDGKTKCFDKNGDGYVRADAINVIFLQKAKDAHRIYAEVYHAKGNYKMGPDAHFLPLRQADDIKHFLKNVYSETDLDPKAVEYVEAHGAAIAKADENELQAISEIFSSDKPIKVGSVKSNMGNSESASGLCAVTKLCLAYHTGNLPGNLHYNDPLDIKAINDGNIEIVNDNQSFNRGYTAVNIFSYTGANYHVVLKGHYKKKDLKKYHSNIPHIVLASGRQETSVEKVFELLKDHLLDPEAIGLLHKTYEYDIPGHTGRGYAILAKNNENQTVSLSQSVAYYPGGKRPLWFVYSGMGSQWAGMGADLMKIPSFAASIQNCHKILKPKGLDLIKIVTQPDPSIFDNIVNAFVGIGAIQIALTDLMREMGIVPDNIIGHSLGEMACAYQDGTFTAEELILSTYCRGKVCLDTPLIKGSMAAVGMGYQALLTQCPPDIDIACRNSSESCTISGPAESVQLFLEELTKRGVFAREVPSANMAYHSRYIADVGPQLLKLLREILKNPKRRSTKWISTSAPQEKWTEPKALYSSAEYHTNNLLKPVLFEEMSKLIPDNAIVVEIAPHGLLQAILKRSHQSCTHIPLTRRGNKDGVKFFLEAIGKLYEVGINPKVDVLYPKIEFPVSTETPLLSHFVDWEHSEDWPMLSYLEKDEVKTASARNVVISVQDDDYSYLEGYVRNGVNVLPESAILVLVWETLAMHTGVNYRNQSVVFRNIHFHCEANILSETPLRLLISITRGNNKFEVTNEGRRIVSGIVSGVKVLKFRHLVEEKIEKDINSFEEEIVLSSDDIYRLMHMRGYSYKNEFKSILTTNLERNQAYVRQTSNWVTFLDSLLQLYNLSRDVETISYPKFIQTFRISVPEQDIAKADYIDGVDCYNAQYIETYRLIRCAGVEIQNVTFMDKPVVEQEPGILKTKMFFPHYSMDNADIQTALEINLQVIEENTSKPGMTISCASNIITKELPKCIQYLNADINILEISESDIEHSLRLLGHDISKTNVLIVENVLGNEKKLNILQNLPKNYFIMILETKVPNIRSNIKDNFTIITSMSDGKTIIMLMKRKYIEEATYISTPFDKLTWITRVNEELKKTKRVVLVSGRQPYCGAIGCVNKLKKDGMNKISVLTTEDFTAPLFDPEANIYKEQLQKNLTVNVLKKGQWGGYYYAQSTKTKKLRNFTLITSSPGIIDGLKWIEAVPISANKNVVQVSFAGLSLKDVKKATGVLIEESTHFGMDFSGIDKDGDRVMGLVGHGAMSATVEADPYLLWPVPDHWSLQDAATVPLAYSLAYYCLVIKGRILRGQSILVTGGAGALGQAVITICLSLGCTVFTTVSSQQKKSFLKKLFPKLNDCNIAYSRNVSFADMVNSYVKGRGCDFVINCTTGHLRLAAMKCVGTSGFFLDVADFDMHENNDIGMNFFSKERNYRGVDLSSVFKYENIQDKKLLSWLISDGIARGIVKPISRIEFGPENITKAFRLLSSNNNIGKVLIKLRSPEILRQGLEIRPRINFDTKGSYIVVCDKHGMGIELADWLVKRGAKNIVLHLDTKVSGYLQTKFLTWSKYNATIRVSMEKINTDAGCIKLIKEAAKLGPVKGVFVINYSLETDVNDEYLLKVRENTLNVIHLDLTTKQYCKDLSYFVILATPSKSPLNAYGVSLFEKIVEERTKTGYPALILRSQDIKEFEYFYDEPNTSAKFPSQNLSAIFSAMESCLKLKHKNVLALNLLPRNTDSYISELEKILNLSVTKHSTTVKELNVNEMTLNEIRSLLFKHYRMDYPLEEIQQMTIKSLKQMKNLNLIMRKKSGLNVFYSTIDLEENELVKSHPIISLVTLLNNGADTDLNPNDTYLTMIPGFEGLCRIFEMAAERLKVQAVGVQLGPDMMGNSISEIALNVRQFMKTKFETKSKFYLLGYSFGVNIALELAALLEQEGHIGVVFCLDSSPDALKLQIEAYAGNLEQSKLQTAVAIHMCRLMSGNENPALEIELKKVDNWNNKVDICMKELKGTNNFSNQYKRAVLYAAYKRIALSQDYKPDLKLSSEIVLIRSSDVINGLAEDYNLSKYTEKSVKVFKMKSDHASIPYDCKVTNIVNNMLDTELLNDFNTKNLCEKYVIKANVV